jgi:hypothetical protein
LICSWLPLILFTPFVTGLFPVKKIEDEFAYKHLRIAIIILQSDFCNMNFAEYKSVITA